MPLKTYLPDGDIDLTCLGPPNYEDSLAVNVQSILEAEERNKFAEFQVSDIQCINAEVVRFFTSHSFFYIIRKPYESHCL